MTTTTDTHKTKVIFLLGPEEGEPTAPKTAYAYFPEEKYNEQKNMFTGYAHIGQHTAIHKYYAMNSDLATPEQYNDLKEELISIGYNLDIQKSKKLI